MAVRRSLQDYQSAGFGGLCFATDLNFMNLPMTYEQRIWALEGMFWCIVAKVEDDPKFKDDNDLGLLIGGTRILLDQVGNDYMSKYENHETHSTDENKYRILQCQTFGKITQLQGKTKMIERVQQEQEVFA